MEKHTMNYTQKESEERYFIDVLLKQSKECIWQDHLHYTKESWGGFIILTILILELNNNWLVMY